MLFQDSLMNRKFKRAEFTVKIKIKKFKQFKSLGSVMFCKTFLIL